MSKFKVGDKVRTSTDAHYKIASFGGHEEHPLPGGYQGEEGTVDAGRDSDGDYLIAFEGGGRQHVSEECLELVDNKAIIGTATVKVEVKFFIGDRDVSELIAKAVSL